MARFLIPGNPAAACSASTCTKASTRNSSRGCTALVEQYRLGDPLDPQTTLGPVVRASAADAIRGQIQASIRAGARPLIDERAFPHSKAGTPYLAPQLLRDAPPTSVVMREEIFGRSPA